MLLLLGAGWGCTSHPSPSATPLAISRPLRAEDLIAGHFVAYTLFWQVGVPGGDPVIFGPDGSIQNVRAGLQGPWVLLSDTSLRIGNRVFYQRVSTGDLASSLSGDTLSGRPVYWIRRAGSGAPLE
jgi:hypothetical protein